MEVNAHLAGSTKQKLFKQVTAFTSYFKQLSEHKGLKEGKNVFTKWTFMFGRNSRLNLPSFTKHFFKCSTDKNLVHLYFVNHTTSTHLELGDEERENLFIFRCVTAIRDECNSLFQIGFCKLFLSAVVFVLTESYFAAIAVHMITTNSGMF